MRKWLRVAMLLAVSFGSATVFAQESLEKVVVRNRLYETAQKFEAGVAAGFTLVNELTSHTNFTLDLAYNINETLAVEARAGYALSGHTGLAEQIGSDLLANPVNNNGNVFPNVVDDLSNLWEMKLNVVAGLRWAPIYGKISVLAEFPVHFQFYLALDAGVGTFSRTSVVYCLAQPAGGQCPRWETESKVDWLGSPAVGLRLFTHKGGAIKVEGRDYLFPDQYLVQIDRRIGQQGSPTGLQASSPGLSNIFLADLGYSLFF